MSQAGTVRSAANGAVIWSAAPKAAAAIAEGGVVYDIEKTGGCPNTAVVIARRGADGRELWRGALDRCGEAAEGMADSALTVDATRIYATGSGGTIALARDDGRRLWRSERGDGGLPAVTTGDRLVVPQFGGGSILSAVSGQILDAIQIAHSPAVNDGRVVFDVGTQGRGQLFSGAAGSWVNGLGSFVSQPLITGATIYVVRKAKSPGDESSTQRLDAIDSETGRSQWHVAARGVGGNGLSVAYGLLLHAYPARLTAYESIWHPHVGGIDAKATRAITFGSRGSIAGVLSPELRSARPRVAIEFDPFPFGGRWLAGITGASGPDGYTSFSDNPPRNARYRLRVGRAYSRPTTIYVYPKVTFRTARSGNAIRYAATFRAPRSVRLAGRVAVLYLGRPAQHRLDRLAGARLTGARRGLARAAFRFGAIANLGGLEFVYACIIGQHRLGLGQPDNVLRHCGRSHIRLPRN